MQSKCRMVWILTTTVVVVAASAASDAQAEESDHRRDYENKSITFRDIASRRYSGIDYRRSPSERFSVIQGFQADQGIDIDALPFAPLKARGAPGVALFDYDRDGDLDIYVTNGPGTPNSLYQNRYHPEGRLRFVDVAESAGVAATASDGTGTCFGDLDNDGDQDLLVLAFNAPHSLFENLGDGTFADVSASSGLDYDQGAMSCAMGDVDGDGRLDIAIANISNLENVLAFFVEPFVYNVPNQLFVNKGGLRFNDASESSGIQTSDGVPAGAATMTWAVTIVDADLDGDQDILFADDQAGMPNTAQGGVDRGFIQLMENDGNGRFTPQRISATGEWMGLAVSDFNCDGTLDVFGSNFGDYGFAGMNPAYQLGDSTSRWYLRTPGGAYVDPGVGGLTATPFGWGASSFDYDNDGDPDLIFHGGMDVVTAVDQSNPGALLNNQGCAATFERDSAALARSADHVRRTVQGVAVGDLNLDGFEDIVTVSSVDVPEDVESTPYGIDYGSPFDDDAVFVPVFMPLTPSRLQWTGVSMDDGTLAVEINSGRNGNGWVAVDVRGSVGLTDDGTVNRDGIGAVVRVTPKYGRTAMAPILGGSSYASQDSLTATFGLKRAPTATVEVQWPSGVVNRLYDVHAGERLVMPEIPCPMPSGKRGLRKFRRCVRRAVRDLVAADVIDRAYGRRLRKSALRAFYDR